MFEGINWLAVLVSGLAFFAIGSVWYSVLFGKKWAKLAGIDWENPGGNMGLIFGSTLVLELLACLVVAILIRDVGYTSWQGGLHIGLMTGIGIVLPSTAINYLFQRKSMMLTAIDVGYMALGLAIAGAIIGAWR